MENNNINISDAVNVSDKLATEHIEKEPPIKGVVSIYDKDGNLVKQVHNMIVNGGRYLLYGLFLNYALYGDKGIAKNTLIPNIDIGSQLTNDGNAETITLDKMSNSIFSINFSYVTDTVKTTPELNISDISALNGGNEASTSTFKLDSEDASSGVSVEADPFDLKVTFKSTIHGNTNFQKFNQIYLTYNLCDYDDNGKSYKENDSLPTLLFSRVIMDPVFIGADGEYSIHYSLFF